MNYIPNILNHFNTLNLYKNNIKLALENKGINMTNITFENYPEKVEELKCNLTYIKFSNPNRTNFDRELSFFNFNNFKFTSNMFSGCNNLITVPNFNTSNVTNMDGMFSYCNNLTNIPEFNTSNVTNISNMFYGCNNLSNASIQNIINMCLNSNITNLTLMNLSNINSYSPLYSTKFNSSYYSNRLTDLTNAGWTY